MVIAHVWTVPAEIALNRPFGGVACPALSEPQQTASSAVVIAHVKLPPAVTAMYEPEGTVV